MPELVLKLAANGAVLAVAAVGWGLEHWWRGSRISARRRWAYWLFVLILFGSIVNGVVTWRSHSEAQEREERMARIDQGVADLVKLAREQDPRLTEQEALKKIGSEIRALRGRTFKLERALDGVKRYSSVAKLNGLGVSGMVGPGSGLKETTPISRALEGAYIRKNVGGKEEHFPRCDEKGIAAFRKAAEIDQDFPFSYWAQAKCARRVGNKEWRNHAERAVRILEHTTQIAGHHGHHDQVLEELRSWLGRP